jgi:hypothetical protein
VAETPEPPHGDTTDKPNPIPNARSTSVRAQLTTAPAATAAHETPRAGWLTSIIFRLNNYGFYHGAPSQLCG